MSWSDALSFPYVAVVVGLVPGFLVLGLVATGLRFLVGYVRSALGGFD